MIRKIRRILFLAAAGAFYYSGLSSLWLSIRGGVLRKHGICVIGLHRVLTDSERQRSSSLDAIVMREESFANTLEYLGRHFEVISLGTFIKNLREGSSGGKPQCLITFDDGWRDNLTTALPLLQRHAMPAVVFVVTSFIEQRQTFWVERLRRLWRDPKLRVRLQQDLVAADNSIPPDLEIENLIERMKHMPAAQRRDLLEGSFNRADAGSPYYGDEMFTWEEAAILQRAGVDIESHTASHPLLVYESDETIAHELAESKRTLEEKLNKKVRAFAYPNGTWDKRVRDLVEEAGYDCAFIIQRGWHSPGGDPYAIRRITLHEGNVTGIGGKFSPAALALRISGLI
jgi:peptidoglycan/xylan/chitin deacetylase (PgdA/CDA1 family)